MSSVAKYYVATYGDFGIEVEFFCTLDAYNDAINDAINDAQGRHCKGEIDTYIHGEVSV